MSQNFVDSRLDESRIGFFFSSIEKRTRLPRTISFLGSLNFFTGQKNSTKHFTFSFFSLPLFLFDRRKWKLDFMQRSRIFDSTGRVVSFPVRTKSKFRLFSFKEFRLFDRRKFETIDRYFSTGSFSPCWVLQNSSLRFCSIDSVFTGFSNVFSWFGFSNSVVVGSIFRPVKRRSKARKKVHRTKISSTRTIYSFHRSKTNCKKN